jgi:asparagine synthase (glutamine-hydrolysing)
MYGLTGFICNNLETQSEITEQLELMTNSIIHRGPDDYGYWIDHKNKVAIGHRRLSVIDLSAASHQPLQSSSLRYVYYVQV